MHALKVLQDTGSTEYAVEAYNTVRLWEDEVPMASSCHGVIAEDILSAILCSMSGNADRFISVLRGNLSTNLEEQLLLFSFHGDLKRIASLNQGRLPHKELEAIAAIAHD